MMASGLEKQLSRCINSGTQPAFCNNTDVYNNVKQAYNNLWDVIEANSNLLRTEVWSWVYNNGFKYTPLGALPAPDGSAQTESDIVQVYYQHIYILIVALELDITVFCPAKPKSEMSF
jgi:hypothetical protein